MMRSKTIKIITMHAHVMLVSELIFWFWFFYYTTICKSQGYCFGGKLPTSAPNPYDRVVCLL